MSTLLKKLFETLDERLCVCVLRKRQNNYY